VIELKKTIIIFTLIFSLVFCLVGCGPQKVEFTDIAALAGAGDEDVVALLGEGDVQFIGDAMLAREYEFNTLGKKCTGSILYKDDYVTQIALYFEDKNDTFSQLNVELWNYYADPDSTVEGEDGSLNHIWITEENSAVALRKAVEGTVRVTVDASRKKAE